MVLRKTILLFLAVICFVDAPLARAQAPVMVALGDSLGEGVQSADANLQTQRFSYANILAYKIGVPFPLPLIQSGPLGSVGNLAGRSRVNPALLPANLAVSGADVSTILQDRADGTLDSETDLVLEPRMGSQIEIAESLSAPFVACWIGSNDALSAVTAFDHLDASQMTPVDQFTANFQEIVARLTSSGKAVVLANIPDVADVAFLFDRTDLVRFLGSDYGLPAGSFTTLPAMMLVKLGLASGSIFQNPSYVLDPSELALIQNRIDAFNGVIAQVATAAGVPVVDVHGLFKSIAASNLSLFGVPLSTRYLGGLFSLDGIHPSNLGYAIVASAFISTINAHFHVAVPQLSSAEWTSLFMTDPFIDKDGDGRVTGRHNAGLLESLGPILGVSGDTNDQIPSSFAGGLTPGQGAALLEAYAGASAAQAQRSGSAAPEPETAIAALRRLFGARASTQR